MSHIRDMIFVKSLERQLRRRLTDEEMSGEPFRAVFPDGHAEFTAVPLLRFPDDLLTRVEDAVEDIPLPDVEKPNSNVSEEVQLQITG